MPDSSHSPGTFELDPTANSSPAPVQATRPAADERLPLTLMTLNAWWFRNLRWYPIAFLLLLGFISLATDGFSRLGLQLKPLWPLSIAGVLIVANIGYTAHLHYIEHRKRLQETVLNIRAQIAVDLILLTVVVHHIGSLETAAAFVYVFHIVLACLAFSRLESFIVTLSAFGLYLGCLAAEASGLWSTRAGIFATGLARESLGELEILMNIAIIFVSWFILWYLASHIAAMIHQRDRDLATTNQRLVSSQTEKTKHMLRTTHELKAPFAAIHANTQLLINGYCGAVPAEALAVIRRIAERARRLSREIQAMLQLANLSTVERASLRWTRTDLADIVQRAVDQIQPLAAERGITIELNLRTAITYTVEDHLVMLLTNLLSNAVAYSHKGGTVKASCEPEGDALAVLAIEDHGIGIPFEKLPKIFDEYYRTEEAVSHNKESSGLGLAIVKSVAQMHKIRIRVETTPGKGSKFICYAPLNTAPQRDGKSGKMSKAEWLFGKHKSA